MIDNLFARSLVIKYGSPLYMYDLEEVMRRAKSLRSVLPENSSLFYSFKANPLPAIASILRSQGCRAEVSSTGELKAAFEAGFIPDQILYSGPGKTIEEIRKALGCGVYYFSCESWHDLNRLALVTSELHLRIKVLLRVNPATKPKARLAMTGIPSQFGFEEEELIAKAELIQSLDGIEISGIHIYFGTQIDLYSLVPTIQLAIQTAERLSSYLDLIFQIVDVGGGFPWPYATTGEGPNLTEIRDSLSRLAEQRERTALSQLWFESGRYLTASSGTLLATVLSIKETKEGKRFVILDTGINCLGGMAGLGRILRHSMSIETLDSVSQVDTYTVDIVGPLCTPLDCLASNINIRRLSVGDIVYIPNVGAYGLTASLVGFLSRSTPVEIAYRDNQDIDVYHLQTGHKKLN